MGTGLGLKGEKFHCNAKSFFLIHVLSIGFTFSVPPIALLQISYPALALSWTAPEA